jgi:hypothetical protein
MCSINILRKKMPQKRYVQYEKDEDFGSLCYDGDENDNEEKLDAKLKKIIQDDSPRPRRV